jgi:hypothetical protein
MTGRQDDRKAGGQESETTELPSSPGCILSSLFPAVLSSCPPVLPSSRPPVLPSVSVLPYALQAPTFRFRGLANLAGRAPIGGAREVALACFVAARLAHECTHAVGEEQEARAARSAAAKAWLGTLALPSTVRSQVVRCAELSVDGQSVAVAGELAALVQAAATFLDQPSRAELDALTAALRG